MGRQYKKVLFQTEIRYYRMMIKKIFYSGPKASVLHSEYAKQGQLDENAGSHALDSIDINADPETIWKLLVDMHSWPTFNPVVGDVKLPQGVHVDAEGSFKLNSFPVTFTFAVVEPGKQLSWTGKSLWTNAIDRFTIEPISAGVTRLHLDESLAGVFASLISSSKLLHKQHRASLESFKKAAEASYK